MHWKCYIEEWIISSDLWVSMYLNMFTKLYVYLYTLYIHIKEYVVMIYSWNDSPNLPITPNFRRWIFFVIFVNYTEITKFLSRKFPYSTGTPGLKLLKSWNNDEWQKLAKNFWPQNLELIVFAYMYICLFLCV